jgi:protein-S-isoprenylcysteine O-methyltransferase Ste14
MVAIAAQFGNFVKIINRGLSTQIMENTANQQFKITQLTAVNVAKAIPIFLLIGCAILFGIHDVRQVIYLCLHISYCVWWLVEQWFYPKRGEMLFNEPAGVFEFIFILFYVGFLYTLPGYLAFVNPEPISMITVGIALPLFFFGSLINASADAQKLTAKEFGAGLVQDNIWRLSRNINYFGDLMRYLSFAVVAGSLWAYIVPGQVMALYLLRMNQKDLSPAEVFFVFRV